MAIYLHNCVSITPSARAAFDRLAQEYRDIGDSPQVASIKWGTVYPRGGASYQSLVLGYYCIPESEELPPDEIGTIDGLTCVFAASEDRRPFFAGKTIDWTPSEGWVLREAPK